MNAKEKTALIVAPYFPPHTGGLERYAKSIADGLVRDGGWRVVVLTTGEKGVPETLEEGDGYRIHRLGYSFKISNTPFSFRWLFAVPRLIRTVRPDLINVHTPVPGLGDVAAFFSGRHPLVVTYHAGSMKKGSPVADAAVWLYEHGPMRSMLDRADRVICSSDAVRDDFLADWRHKSITVTPGVDVGQFSPGARTKHAPTLLFVAGLGKAERHKGLELLLETFAKLRSAHPDLQLSVVGDGDRREAYEQEADTLGISDAVAFRGRLGGVTLADAYRSADIFVLPTSNDSAPTVIVEAMATGLPVVSTTVGGIPALVADRETGFLVEPGDGAALYARLHELLRDPAHARQMGAAGRERALAERTWAPRLRRHQEAFESAYQAAAMPLIAHVAAYYPPHIGGLERVAKTFAEQLAQRGWRVLVLTSACGGRPATARDGRLTVRRLAAFEFAHTPVVPLLLWHLLRLPKRSLIHLHFAQAYWPEMVWLASRIRGIPYIAHFHLDVEPSGRLGALFVAYKRMLWGPLLRRAQGVIALSEEQKGLIARKFGVQAARITVVANGVDDRYFVDAAESAASRFRLLSLGRLTVQKRIDRLIEAMALVRSPAHLTIAGDGEDRAELEALVARACPGRVSFVGSQPSEDVPGLCSRHDAFLISSEKEGLPLAILEAMAAGLPVIGSDVIGVRELVSGAGVLVHEPYAEEFAEAIDALWKDTRRRAELSRKSRAQAAAHRWEVLLPRVEAAYARLRS